jgi:hypothetical protein
MKEDVTMKAEGAPVDLKGGIQGDILALTVNHIENAPEVALGVLRDLEMVREASTEGGSVRLVVTRGGEALPIVLRLLQGRGIAVADIALSRPSLDDVFLRATGHSLKDEAALAAAAPVRHHAPPDAGTENHPSHRLGEPVRLRSDRIASTVPRELRRFRDRREPGAAQRLRRPGVLVGDPLIQARGGVARG